MDECDADDFGPMVQAEIFPSDANELETLRRQVHELLEEKRASEAEFGMQRAKFMEIFKQKEEDLRKTYDKLNASLAQCSKQDQEISTLKDQVHKLSSETNEIKTRATIDEVKRAEETENQQRRYEEELASLQSIIKELTGQVQHPSSAQYEQEIAKLVRQKDKLESELTELRNKAGRDREGILTSITKTIQKRVGNADLREPEEENLEYSMRKAQEDTEKLRILISPFEEEIASLKDELKCCHERINFLESQELAISEQELSKRTHSVPNELCSSGQSQSLSDLTGKTSNNHEGLNSVQRPEFSTLPKQVVNTRHPCSHCKKYEAQIQVLHENEKHLNERLSTSERLLANETQKTGQLEKYNEMLEKELNLTAVDARFQLSTLANRVEDSEKFLQAATKHFAESKQQLQEQMSVMASYREDMQAEMTRLQKENDELIGKHSQCAQELQDETINLPNSFEDIQILLLKYREEIITEKVAKEHVESTLRKELEDARAQLQQYNTTERKMAQEVNQLREELGIRNSLYAELEQHIRNSDNLKNLADVQAELNQCKTAKHKLERTVQTLRKDLTNSEAAQKDFMQFSQKLQIELDKHQVNNHEVRWQHPDDVTECGQCQKSFILDTTQKDNCRHCGRIFCEECLNQSFPSGPTRRPAIVCCDCHKHLAKAAESGDNRHSESLKEESPTAQ